MQLLADLLWAITMVQARRFRRGISPASRRRFDAAMGLTTIDFPDGVYNVSSHDLTRAVRAAKTPRTT